MNADSPKPESVIRDPSSRPSPGTGGEARREQRLPGSDPVNPPSFRAVILSIRPQHTSRIMAGEKTVELRRRFPVSLPKGTIAYIYSTSPEQAMVGHAGIGGVRQLDVEEIWQRHADAACVEREDFDRYFDGLDRGFAIEFENARRFGKPLSLSFLRERFEFKPPQSFLYAKQDLRTMLLGERSIASH